MEDNHPPITFQPPRYLKPLPKILLTPNQPTTAITLTSRVIMRDNKPPIPFIHNLHHIQFYIMPSKGLTSHIPRPHNPEISLEQGAHTIHFAYKHNIYYTYMYGADWLWVPTRIHECIANMHSYLHVCVCTYTHIHGQYAHLSYACYCNQAGCLTMLS